jgi:hypothetical protein
MSNMKLVITEKRDLKKEGPKEQGTCRRGPQGLELLKESSLSRKKW